MGIFGRAPGFFVEALVCRRSECIYGSLFLRNHCFLCVSIQNTPHNKHLFRNSIDTTITQDENLASSKPTRSLIILSINIYFKNTQQTLVLALALTLSTATTATTLLATSKHSPSPPASKIGTVVPKHRRSAAPQRRLLVRRACETRLQGY